MTSQKEQPINRVDETINSFLDASKALRVLLTEIRQSLPLWSVTASIENDHGRPYIEFRVTVPEKVSREIVEARLEEVFHWTANLWKFVPAVDIGRGYSLDTNSWYRKISL